MADFYQYKPAILRALEAHGVKPRPSTPPTLVHEFVSDLYRYELRRMRSRLIRGEFPKSDYFSRVSALRRRYGVISLRASEWVE